MHTALDGFPLSLTKMAAIEDLMDDPYAADDSGVPYTQQKWEYYFTLGKYHDRWSELKKSDFICEWSRQKGAEMAIRVAKPEEYDITDEYAEENGVGYVYLRRMIEEFTQMGVDVLLVHLLYPSDEDDQMNGNTVGEIAYDYGIDYIDFVNLDQAADYLTDCYDSDSHLNPSGARKVSDYLGRYIAEHYGLADRRGDPAYAGFAAELDDYVDLKLDYLRSRTQMDELLMLLHDDDFSVCISIAEHSPVYEDETLMTLLHNIAREHVFEEDAYSKWSNAMFLLEWLEEAAGAGEAYAMSVNRKTGVISEAVGGDALGDETPFGPFSCAAGESGMRIMIVDERTGKPVMQAGF